MQHSALFEKLIAGKALEADEMRAVLEACISGQWSESQIAVFLALMRAKGETVEELTVAAKRLLECTPSIDLGMPTLDIVGTGGDGLHTFNISTLSSIVAAACGAHVAKQGARSVSSSSGSADLLSLAGVSLEVNTSQLRASLSRCGLCFLFAPHFHPALNQVRSARQSLGIRSFFNLLGPLINPVRPAYQMVGVFSSSWLQPIANVLANLGCTHALVVHAQDGLDECSVAALTDIVEYRKGRFHTWSLNPADYGLYHASLESIVVDSPQQSLALIESVLQGQQSVARDITVLNTACALYCADLVNDISSGVACAQHALDSGKAARCFSQLRTFS